MNKALNSKFIKQLIDSDFLFSKSSLTKKGLYSNISIDSKNQLNILDIFKLNTSLKQFMRILQLLKSNKNFCIHIWCNNNYFLELINKFILDFSMTDIVSTSDVFPTINSSNNKTEFLFILGKPWIEKHEKLICNKILQSNIFLVNKFNLNIEKQSSGIYKIQNDLYDYKKLILLLVLIYNTLKIK